MCRYSHLGHVFVHNRKRIGEATNSASAGNLRTRLCRSKHLKVSATLLDCSLVSREVRLLFDVCHDKFLDICNGLSIYLLPAASFRYFRSFWRRMRRTGRNDRDSGPIKRPGEPLLDSPPPATNHTSQTFTPSISTQHPPQPDRGHIELGIAALYLTNTPSGATKGARRLPAPANRNIRLHRSLQTLSDAQTLVNSGQAIG